MIEKTDRDIERGHSTARDSFPKLRRLADALEQPQAALKFFGCS